MEEDLKIRTFKGETDASNDEVSEVFRKHGLSLSVKITRSYMHSRQIIGGAHYFLKFSK